MTTTNAGWIFPVAALATFVGLGIIGIRTMPHPAPSLHCDGPSHELIWDPFTETATCEKVAKP